MKCTVVGCKNEAVEGNDFCFTCDKHMDDHFEETRRRYELLEKKHLGDPDLKLEFITNRSD